jgi:hypothetical protein
MNADLLIPGRQSTKKIEGLKVCRQGGNAGQGYKQQKARPLRQRAFAFHRLFVVI